MNLDTHQRTRGLAIMALTLTTMGLSQAQPTAGGPDVAQAGKIAKAKKAGKGQKAKNQTMLSPAMLVKVLGKPLTTDQFTAVQAAAKTYNETVAKAVGLTPEELATKAKEYRQEQKAKKEAKPAAA